MRDYEVLAPFALGTARVEGREKAIVLDSRGNVRSLTGVVPDDGDLFTLLQDWKDVASDLVGIDPLELPAIEDADVLAPLRFPRKVLCIAANHRDHLADVGADVEKAIANWKPFFFMKAPTTSVVGPQDSVRIPSIPDPRLDWEGELGAVMGLPLSYGTSGGAKMAIAGYVPVNDLTVRGALLRPDAGLERTRFDWVGAKSFDGSLPMGPGLVPTELIDDPNDLQITVTAASHIMTLEPGDVVATGTPGGVGGVKGLQLDSGSVVTVKIQSVGSITTRIV